MAVQKRSKIKPGMLVRVVLKKDQRSGALTEGVVKRILTKSANHPRGIKVMLDDGLVGRVQEIVDAEVVEEDDVWDLIGKVKSGELEEDEELDW